MISFVCPKCNITQQVENRMQGKKLPCGNCGQRLQVPLPPEMQTMQAALASANAPAEHAPSSTSRVKEWHYERKGQTCGPVREADLKALAVEQKLSPNDRVWSEGMSDWQEAGAVLPRLFVKHHAPAETAAVTKIAEASARRWEGIGFAFYAVLVGGVLVGLFGLLYMIARPHLNKQVDVAKKSEEEKKPEPPRDLTTKEIVTRCRAGVARVQNRVGTGSGFLIEPGVVVTNAHVVEGDLVEHLQVTFPSAADGNKPIRAKLLLFDRKRDLAVLKIQYSATPLQLADEDPSVGEKVVVIGSPGTVGGRVLENAPTSGELGPVAPVNGVDFYSMSASINGGNSGGPVFNSQGKVIGVATLSAIGKQSQNFAGTLTNIRDVLRIARKNQEKEAWDEVAAEYDLGETFQRLALATGLYARAMRHYVIRMIEAEKRKESAQVGINRASSEIDKFVLEQNKDLLEMFPAGAMAPIVSNRALPDRIRDCEEMHKLRKLHTDFKLAVDGPRFPMTATYRDNYVAQNEERKRLLESLKSKLGIDRGRLIRRAQGFQLLKFMDEDDDY